eukprot:7141243-Alexandrium_andersonii.AAC.1
MFQVLGLLCGRLPFRAWVHRSRPPAPQAAICSARLSLYWPAACARYASSTSCSEDLATESAAAAAMERKA